MEQRRDEQNPDREMMENVPQEPITADPTEEGEAKDVYTGITLRLKLDDQTNIDIPLVADRLAPADAKLPDGYSLEELKVE